ncbi:MAG: hypothetical protein A3F61_01035 [Candidatus Blackburnbacteria bacterium RIFCSPHIGHO2_12_FULL_41_13b]|uniref:Uncharacterized protein n=1 Tax=Candidatus Blackburnbacteria bacterium RIFCSPHIGHO2_12_FULL_41_13b TaxID=1797517 RepID=A0A1G1VA28_9BACT|nr:MAG: hypothetical protein A3F61_01035 [Candidatus Blackburnbacteria bacterium RIFCSPHIGHO2_12_FULL_41_13b]
MKEGISYSPLPEVIYKDDLLNPNCPYEVRVNTELYALLLKAYGITKGRSIIANTKIVLSRELPLRDHPFKRSGYKTLGDYRNDDTINIYPEWIYREFPDCQPEASIILSQTLLHETSHRLDSFKAHVAIQAGLGVAFDLKYGLLWFQAMSVITESAQISNIWSVIGATLLGWLVTQGPIKPLRDKVIYWAHPYEIKADKFSKVFSTFPLLQHLVTIKPK